MDFDSVVLHDLDKALQESYHKTPTTATYKMHSAWNFNILLFPKDKEFALSLSTHKT